MRSRWRSLLGLVTVTSCFTSPSLSRDPIALSPLGVHGVVTVGSTRFSGELLTLTSADFVLLTSERLVVIPFLIAGSGNFGSIDIGTFGAPWPKNAEQLRYASRYPYGIPEPALKAILASRSQTAPDTVKAASR